MEKIDLPKKIDIKKGKSSNQGIITIEPCYPGYGITLGNALRRVLLSSLTGAAPVGVKIEGAGHEFMTLPHVKEDILEIILNLKQLKLKVFSDEEVKLKLEAHGEKIVKAGDINKDAQVEIANPDLVLAHITDMSGSLNMEILINKGKGYRPVENIENKKNEIGYIEMDSIFSPVLSVGIDIDNVRVGKMTNWDKLILDVETDGTISPQEAFEKSVKILIEQFFALVNNDKEADVAVKDPLVSSEQEKEETKEKKDKETDKKKEISIKKKTGEKKLADAKAMVDKPKKKKGRPKNNEE